ncbi:MAG: J domain-containing protein, partial [Anaerolineae bacterium]
FLGLSPRASLDEIRLAYRKQARAYHPDLSTDPDAAERFREVNEAYEILANAEKRHAYDYFTAGMPPLETPQVDDAPSNAPSPPLSVSSEPPVLGAIPVMPPPLSASRVQAPRRVYPPTWAILLIVVGACTIVGVGIGAFLSLRRNRPTGGAGTVDVVKLATFLSPPSIPDNLTVLQEDDMPLRTVAPIQLMVGGNTYPVVAVVPEQGRWPMPAEQEQLGVWIYGTLINYVIGMPYTADMENLLSGLTSSDRLSLTLESGATLVFGSPQLKRVALDDTSPLAQDTPELTLLTLGDNSSNRLVVKARYLPENVAPVDEQNADGLGVKIMRADVVQGVVPDDAASEYFVVEFEVTNGNASAVDPAFFDMVLEDARGQRYMLNDIATSKGSYGQLSLPVLAGATVSGSAGYVIPRQVVTPLVWIFRADVTSTDAVRFVTSYEPPAPTPAAPEVELYEAFLDRSRDVIVISGTVFNDGGQNLSVATESVELTSSVGRSRLVASTPLLPWPITPGSYQDFELQFEAPASTDSVLLNILGFTFEIEGLIP